METHFLIILIRDGGLGDLPHTPQVCLDSLSRKTFVWLTYLCLFSIICKFFVILHSLSCVNLIAQVNTTLRWDDSVYSSSFQRSAYLRIQSLRTFYLKRQAKDKISLRNLKSYTRLSYIHNTHKLVVLQNTQYTPLVYSWIGTNFQNELS